MQTSKEISEKLLSLKINSDDLIKRSKQRIQDITKQIIEKSIVDNIDPEHLFPLKKEFNDEFQELAKLLSSWQSDNENKINSNLSANISFIQQAKEEHKKSFEIALSSYITQKLEKLNAANPISLTSKDLSVQYAAIFSQVLNLLHSVKTKSPEHLNFLIENIKEQFFMNFFLKIVNSFKSSIDLKSIKYNLEKILNFIECAKTEDSLISTCYPNEKSPIDSFEKNIAEFSENICSLLSLERNNIKSATETNEFSSKINEIIILLRKLKEIFRSKNNLNQGPIPLATLILKIKWDTTKLIFAKYYQEACAEITSQISEKSSNVDSKSFRKRDFIFHPITTAQTVITAVDHSIKSASQIQEFSGSLHVKDLMHIYTETEGKFDTLESSSITLMELYLPDIITHLCPLLVRSTLAMPEFFFDKTSEINTNYTL